MNKKGLTTTGVVSTGRQPLDENIIVDFKKVSKKFEMPIIGLRGAWEKLIHEKSRIL
jgi:hypothetical protein